MRKILFRGKSVDNGEWIYGAYNNVCENTIIDVDDITHMRIDVIPETVGQYTGLTDKNGNKIFEGDIIEVDDKKRSEIIWDTGKYNQIVGFRLKKYPIFGLNLYNCKIMKVIGNIHDNSELLEEKNNDE